MRKTKEWVSPTLFKQMRLMMHGVLRASNKRKQTMILIIRALIGLGLLKTLNKNNLKRSKKREEPPNHFQKA